MYHYYEAITNTRGDSLPGYYVRAVNSSTNSVASIFSDNSGTPINTVSGVANMALTDADGNVSFFVENGTYNVEIFSSDQTTLVKRVSEIPMFNPQVVDALGTSPTTAPSQKAVTDAINTLTNNQGNVRGNAQYNSSATLLASDAGKVVTLGGAGAQTLTLPLGSSVSAGQRFHLFSQGGNWTIQRNGTDPIAIGSATSGVTSFALFGSDHCDIEWNGSAWIVISGSPIMAIGDSSTPVKPKGATGIGQWTIPTISGSTIVLPAGGTWAYFWSNNGSGGAGVAAGGTTLFSGTLNNAFGFCWRQS